MALLRDIKKVLPMKKYLLSTLFLTLFSGTAFANNGLISLESAYTVKETADRFQNIIKSKGLTLFARIDHSGNAKKANLSLAPTEVILFGNPKVGTPLMQCTPTVAIDLPQKVLVWQDAEDKVWLSYNDPAYLKQRHQMEGCEKVLTKVSAVLEKLGKAATMP